MLFRSLKCVPYAADRFLPGNDSAGSYQKFFLACVLPRSFISFYLFYPTSFFIEDQCVSFEK